MPVKFAPVSYNAKVLILLINKGNSIKRLGGRFSLKLPSRRYRRIGLRRLNHHAPSPMY